LAVPTADGQVFSGSGSTRWTKFVAPALETSY
jgi:hypothetical protein